MLRLDNVRKIYRTEHVETHALSELTLTIAEGEFVAVMGPSGSGKTTILNIAGLLDAFDKGTYHLDGEDVSRLSDSAMSKIRNTKIGFIFQTFNLIPDLNVFDNVDVPLRYRGTAAAARREAPRQRPSACAARSGSRAPRGSQARLRASSAPATRRAARGRSGGPRGWARARR